MQVRPLTYAEKRTKGSKANEGDDHLIQPDTEEGNKDESESGTND
jgi:hypothetical protein